MTVKIVENYFDVVEYVRRSYIKLRETNPKHEYLRFAQFEDDGKVLIEPHFLSAFEPKAFPVRDSMMFRTTTLLNLHERLEKAAQDFD